MVDRPIKQWQNSLVWTFGFVLVTILLVIPAYAVIPPGRVCPDFICFWTSAKLLASGQNPYDPALQTTLQQGLGWVKADDGIGLYDFMPYYYPPWLGLLCVPLLPLGYPLAKIVWLVINFELLLLTGWLLKTIIKSLPRLVPIVVVPGFILSLSALVMGQVSPLVLFLIVVTWKLVNVRRDDAAGCLLALAGFKPQLTGLLWLGILCWSARQERWRIVRGFGVTGAALCLTSTLVTPTWLTAMATATRVTPPPNAYFIGLGTTWFSVLKAARPPAWVLWGGYLLVALPLLAAGLKLVLDRSRRIDDVISVSLIGSFFLMPYSRAYDFPVLLIPALVLVGNYLRERSAAVLLFVLMVLPYAQQMWLNRIEYGRDTTKLHPEFTYFWLPLLLAASWWYAKRTISIPSGECQTPLTATDAT